MTGLRDTQNRFQAVLTKGANADDPLPGLVSGTAKARVGELMGVYYNAYRLRLIEALGEEFSALRAHMGAKAFADMVVAYMGAWPSRAPSIRWFGRHLSGFLSSDPAYRDDTLLAELAAWEWSLGTAVDAADSPVITIDDMGRIPPDRWDAMTLTFHPSLRLLKINRTVPAYRQAVELTEALDDPRDAPAPTPPLGGAGSEPWMIWRLGIEVFYRSLSDIELRAYRAAREGRTFGDICTDLMTQVPEDEAALTAASFLKTWIEEGWVSAVAA
ncbi:MAG: putative DNA-binding domain-containing protein [Rhodobacterales bacterium]|nr:putative DNA-binding domain-containing protein [Rhodobacterales bacterium]